jgi:RHS repeat-associated protein
MHFSKETGGQITDPPEFTYNSSGQRTRKDAADTHYYHYDQSGQLIAETDTAGTLLKAYIWLHGQPLAMIDPDGAVHYYHNDHLGTPQLMTNADKTTVWSADYLPFGQADVIVATVESNLRFAGQYFDSETGLHYNYHRYYDPKLGRYLRADPIGFEGGDLNLYVYVFNNPINLTDIKGLSAKESLSAKACTRRFDFGPTMYLFPPKHCYIAFGDGTTLSYDNKSVGPDPAPDTKLKACYSIKGDRCECTDECIRGAMYKCDPKAYHFFKNNCCDCVRNALKSCSCEVPLGITLTNAGF